MGVPHALAALSTLSMPTDAEGTKDGFGPWHPGIRSQVPRDLLHLATIFRPENVFTRVADAEELRDLTGIELTHLVTFRPQRLALHELLVRVTADLSVPDGSKIEDLGINFRGITRTLLTGYIEPRMHVIVAAYEGLRQRLTAVIDRELAVLFVPPGIPSDTRARRGLAAFFRRPAAVHAEIDPPGKRESRLLSQWTRQAEASTDALEKSAYQALARVVSALLIRHGHAWGGRELIVTLAVNLACNDFGSGEIGRMLDPWLIDAAQKEAWKQLPRQEHPVVMNTKGASASGKSTLRPLQKALAGQIGVRWDEFALISPDIWRKQLLDYAELGAAYKYGGAFTGDEVRIIDQKLDRYMARKAARGNTSHLLIDRFRFDSFAPDSDEAGSNLLTRFGHVVYLFFMITPPASLVERAWNRGLEFGRYKAVDDTLAHSVDAYAGIPQLFFTWIRRGDKRLHFEFLDNSVPQGQRPRTVAFGTNEVLSVLDVKCMLDIERFRKVNVDATSPASLYADRTALAAEKNTTFLRQCVELFHEVHFAHQDSGRRYLRMVAGEPVWVDGEALQLAAIEPDARAGLAAVAPATLACTGLPPGGPQYLAESAGTPATTTLGRWATVNST
jgi:hypothetical protein